MFSLDVEVLVLERGLGEGLRFLHGLHICACVIWMSSGSIHLKGGVLILGPKTFPNLSCHYIFIWFTSIPAFPVLGFPSGVLQADEFMVA